MAIKSFSQKFSNNDEEEQQAKPIQELRTSSSTEAPIDVNQTASIESGQNNRPQSSSGFVNLQKYLDANKSGSIALGERTASKVNKDIQDSKDTSLKSADDFRKQVSDNTRQYNEGLVNDAVNNSSEFIKDQEKLKQLGQQKSGEYTGPNQFTGSEAANNALKAKQNAEESGELTKTAGGRTELLRQTNKSNDQYTLGGLNLNQYLLQNNEESLDKLLKSGEKTSELQSIYDNSRINSDKAVNDAKEINRVTGQKTNQSLEKALIDQNNVLQTQATQAADNEKAKQEALKEALSKPELGLDGQFPNLSDEQLSNLGISREDYETLKGLNADARYVGKDGINLVDFLRNQLGTYSQTSSATPEQIARYNALAQLAGKQPLLSSGGQAGTSELDIQNAFNQLRSQFGGLSPDELALSGDVKSFDDFYAKLLRQQKAERHAQLGNAAQGAAEGASTGASIGSAIPVVGTVIGGIIGGVIGFLANGGLAIAGRAIDKFTNAIGLDKVFGEDTQGTKDYDAYKKLAPEVPGRVMDADQIGGSMYNAIKQYRKTDLVKTLATVFGADPNNLKDSGQNSLIVQGIDRYMDEALSSAVKNGLLDKNDLEQLDGQQIFNKLVLPKLNADIFKATGQKNLIQPDAGVIERIMADRADWYMFNKVIHGT